MSLILALMGSGFEGLMRNKGKPKGKKITEIIVKRMDEE